MISKSSAAGAFANTSKLKADAIREANEFAASKGKVAVGVSAKELRPRQGFPSYEYQFRLLDADDPAARGTSLRSTADVVVESSVTTTGDADSAKAAGAQPDPTQS